MNSYDFFKDKIDQQKEVIFLAAPNSQLLVGLNWLLDYFDWFP